MLDDSCMPLGQESWETHQDYGHFVSVTGQNKENQVKFSDSSCMKVNISIQETWFCQGFLMAQLHKHTLDTYQYTAIIPVANGYYT